MPSLPATITPPQPVRPRPAGVALALLGAAALLALGGCAAGPGAAGSPIGQVPEIRPGILAGYLPRQDLPDSLVLVPPPPAPGSAAQALDDDIARRATALRGSARWQLASEDAELGFPKAAGAFSCVLGAPVNAQDTPHLYLLLRRTLADAGLATYRAKDQYRRKRPFMVNGQPTCTPQEEAKLVKDGSYPSGHNAVGWAWALVLAEVAPERATAILARGRAFGDSRLVCNVHWQSDANAGRVMGAAAVARLHADPVFRADLALARQELAAARTRGLAPERDCAVEAAAMAQWPAAAPAGQ